MSIYKKDHKAIWEAFDPTIFLKTIEGNDEILREADLLVSREFSMKFNELVDSLSDVYEKCELVYLLFFASKSTWWDSYQAKFQYYYLKKFFEWDDSKVHFNKMNKFIEVTGYEFNTRICISNFHVAHDQYGRKEKITTYELIPTELSAILEEINDPSLNDLILAFRKSKTLIDKESKLFAIQKPYYEKIRKYKVGTFSALDIKKIQRKTEVFVRHGEEARDRATVQFYESLSEDEKIKELEKLLFEWLHFIQLVKMQN